MNYSMNESIRLIGDYVEVHPGIFTESPISFNENLSGSVDGDLEGFRNRINCALRIRIEKSPMNHLFLIIDHLCPNLYCPC